MSAGDRAAWTAAEDPAPRPLAKDFPYIPEPRRGPLRETGRHRRPGRLSTVLAEIKQAARRRGA